MNDRIDKIREYLSENNIDAILIKNLVNVRYLSNFIGTNAMCLITLGNNYFFTDFRYIEQAEEQTKDFKIIKINKKPNNILREILKKEKIKRLGFEEHHMVFEEYKKLQEELKTLELVPSSSCIFELRMRKDNQEKEALKNAAILADKAFSYITEEIKEGHTELDIALKLEFYLRKNGSEGVPFDFIVASGKRAALPHGLPTRKKILKGEMIVLDFGAVVNGYCSDITRTIFLGEPDDKQKYIYNIVFEAQKTALENIVAGISCSKLDGLSREIIKKYGYGEHFGHALGHGVGLEVHEQPKIAQGIKAIIEPGMVFTIEPGIYIKGWGGIRIEDTVIMKEKNIEILTKSSKQLLVL